MLKQLFAAVRPAVATLAATLVLVGAAPQAPTRAASATATADVLSAYDRMPAAFVENRGQLDDEVRYYAQGRRYAFHLTRDRAVLSFLDSSSHAGVTLALGFPGSTGRGGPHGVDRAAGEINYFRGGDSSGWRTGIARYAQVAYRNLWPGIDLPPRRRCRHPEVRVPGAAWRAPIGRPARVTPGRAACQSTKAARC